MVLNVIEGSWVPVYLHGPKRKEIRTVDGSWVEVLAAGDDRKKILAADEAQDFGRHPVLALAHLEIKPHCET